jgi:hypothetical protein
MSDDKLTAAAIAREQELHDIRKVMETKEGRRFVWRLLEEGNIFRKCFSGNSSTFYLEGKRELVLGFYQDIMEGCPELFWQTQQENWQSNGKDK